MTAMRTKLIGRNSVRSFNSGRVITDPLRAPAALTTITTDDRCDTCNWPAVCAEDRTCWRVERGDK